MADALRFEQFDPSRHDRGRFDCGVPVLNHYLRTGLGQHSRKNVTRGYVLATATGTIAGFFTLSSGSLSVNAIPAGYGFPTRVPLPCILLGRLAVDLSFRGKGLGGTLLVHAFNIAVRVSTSVAAAVIEVDAKDESARTFYARYRFQSLPDDNLHMYLPMETAREFLDTEGLA